MEETKGWLEKAKKDIKAAENSISMKDYEWACFQAQQSAEKALKALYIKKYKKLLKIHDLVLLAKRLNAPEEILQFCKELTPAYLYTRYPDISHVENLENLARKFLIYAKDILKWINKNI